MEDFIKHHIIHKWQERQRKYQKENIKQNEVFVHWDFINNPAVYHAIITRRMWGSLDKFEFLVANCVWRNTTIAFFSKTESVSVYVINLSHIFDN